MSLYAMYSLPQHISSNLWTINIYLIYRWSRSLINLLLAYNSFVFKHAILFSDLRLVSLHNYSYYWSKNQFYFSFLINLRQLSVIYLILSITFRPSGATPVQLQQRSWVSETHAVRFVHSHQGADMQWRTNENTCF